MPVAHTVFVGFCCHRLIVVFAKRCSFGIATCLITHLKFGMLQQLEITYAAAEPPFLTVDIHIFYEFIELPLRYLLVGYFMAINLLDAQFSLGWGDAEILANALHNGIQRIDLQRMSILFSLWQATEHPFSLCKFAIGNISLRRSFPTLCICTDRRRHQRQCQK